MSNRKRYLAYFGTRYALLWLSSGVLGSSISSLHRAQDNLLGAKDLSLFFIVLLPYVPHT
jgi:hypothetical protein